MHSTAILDRRIIDIADAERVPPELTAGARNFLTTGYRAITITPMMRGDAAIGALSVIRPRPGPLSDKQIAVLKTFADQAVIAIENTRLLNELRQRTDDLSEALEQQTATSQVFQVISSSPGELEPVFGAMLENTTRICEANFGVLFRFNDGLVEAAAMLGVPPAFAELLQGGPFVADQRSGLGRVAQTKQAVHIIDARAEHEVWLERDPYFVTATELSGTRTLLIVPMLNEDKLMGAIAIYRQEVRPFSDRQIELVTNFANQAVIAIEKLRLLTELRARTAELEDKSSSSRGKPAHVAVPRQHEPRAAHAAQRDHRTDRDDGRQCGALRHGKGTGAAAPRQRRRKAPAGPHQRGTRPLED
jgi:GAF domain-containing protein